MVTRNHAATVERAIELTQSEVAAAGGELWVRDNNSKDGTKELLKKVSVPHLDIGNENLGFSLANNILINRALAEGAEHVLLLNPDAVPMPGAVERMLEASRRTPAAGAVTPKILRANTELKPIEPPTIDAAGMYFTEEFRHFDRGSNETDTGQYDTECFMAGGTGAALLLTRGCIESVSFKKRDGSLELLDERFFAYREDAELGLRMWRYGFKTLYTPAATILHVRHVLPERRSLLADEINRLSVRNRFLLQLSHLTEELPTTLTLRTYARNLVVLLGVLTVERESLPGIKEYLALRKEGNARRREIRSRSRVTKEAYSKIFGAAPFCEPMNASLD